ncbi:hypothetical protein D3C85_1473490 [compost metagenome]
MYLLEQNLNPEKLKIDKNLSNRLNTITIEELKTQRTKGQRIRFYEMTIPVLSFDRQKAYVQLGYHCGSLCGSGKAIYLRKINGKWMIITKWETWIS